jgi:predicted nucleotidyltransferase
LGEIRSSLTTFPALASVHDRLLAELRERRVTAVVRGSIASGQADRFSDIDLLVLAPDAADVATIEHDLLCAIESRWTVLSHFTASHLGLDGLHVLFLDVDDAVVKVDFEVEPAGRQPEQRAEAPAPDQELLAARMCGWLWYTATKIARGERFEAADSLDVMRRAALVPYLLLRSGLPQEGYRRLEGRLAPAFRSRLEQTHPRGFEAAELWRALLATYGWFMELGAEGGLSGDAQRRLRRMLALTRPLSAEALDA